MTQMTHPKKCPPFDPLTHRPSPCFASQRLNRELPLFVLRTEYAVWSWQQRSPQSLWQPLQTTIGPQFSGDLF